MADILDGLSNTVAFGETTSRGRPEQAPAPRRKEPAAVRRILDEFPPLSPTACLDADSSGPGIVEREWSRGVSSWLPITTSTRQTAGFPTARTRAGPPRLTAPRSLHSGGVNTLFCDGHVQFIKESVNATSWRAIATRAGGEVVSSSTIESKPPLRGWQPHSHRNRT